MSAAATLSFLNLQMYAGLTIAGVTNGMYRIDYATDLGISNSWRTLTNIVLPESPYCFLDMQSAGAPRRFYRAKLVP